jgi:hypothetical protein
MQGIDVSGNLFNWFFILWLYCPKLFPFAVSYTEVFHSSFFKQPSLTPAQLHCKLTCLRHLYPRDVTKASNAINNRLLNLSFRPAKENPLLKTSFTSTKLLPLTWRRYFSSMSREKSPHPPFYPEFPTLAKHGKLRVFPPFTERTAVLTQAKYEFVLASSPHSSSVR